ncbi:unnamed protein product [Cyprideis torosa]|uniref:Uncharacterized protein n=1 Tax=Cyprideis torosa TaxID=163714 RepID=A0A7R8WJI0_9CRUS|nr:unnamed protein product [Cyprideis torosa]CAG0902031.1 unnamed protein product [Cyprideis torosa]
MFEHEMLEKQTGEVRINDISAEVIEELLRFMYTGNVKNIEKNIFGELFAAAAKYNFEALKKICEKRLACSLASENLYQTLVLAELHESVYLKDATVRFLRRNPEFLHDEEFASQLKKEGSLAVELCRGLAKAKTVVPLSIRSVVFVSEEVVSIGICKTLREIESKVSFTWENLVMSLKHVIPPGSSFAKKTTATLKKLGLYTGDLKRGDRIWISEYTPLFIKLYSEENLEDFVENCVFNDTLTIQCNITIIRESVETTEFEPPVLPCSSSVVETGEKLFSLGLHSDITLLVEDRKFAVHKNILAAQSPVFGAMFQHDMMEKQTGEVKIADFSAEVIEELLRFMYTGNVKNIEKNRELFAAAAKYNLEALKKICEKRLACSLSSENLYQTLVLAELHESVYLKDASVRFLRRNPEILRDEEFASQLKREGSLAVELCRGLAKEENEDAFVRKSQNEN